jgi:hypothetical protein
MGIVMIQPSKNNPNYTKKGGRNKILPKVVVGLNK